VPLTAPALAAKQVIPRAALAGGIAGVLGLIFAEIFAEPVINQAIDYESDRDDAQNALLVATGQPPNPDGPDIFSRGVQSTVGIGTGMVLAGIALGLLFAVVYTLLQGKLNLRPRVLALVVAGAGVLTLYVTPIIKYPSNPPAVGHEDTIGDRSGLFLIMIVGSVIFLVIGTLVATRVRERFGTWNAVLVGALVYVVLAGILMAVLPSLGELASNVATYGPAATETPQPLRDAGGHLVFPGFDADLLYYFRLYSFAAQAIIWGALALVFGAMAERATGRSEDRTVTPAADTTPQPESSPA
jgi:hypothetical protein